MKIRIRTSPAQGHWQTVQNRHKLTCDRCGDCLWIAPDGTTLYCDRDHSVAAAGSRRDALQRLQEELLIKDEACDLAAVTALFEDETCWILLSRTPIKTLHVVYKADERIMNSVTLT